MDLIGSTLDCRNRVDHAQAAVLMAVPVESHVFALLLNDALDESHNRAGAVRCRMAYGIAHADGASATANCRSVKGANCFRIRARRVFGDEHYRQALTDRKGNCVFRKFQKFVEGPLFGVKAYGRRTNEGAGFDRDADALRNFYDWRDVAAMGARRAVGANLQLLFGDLARQPLDAGGVRLARTRYADV